MTTKATTPVRRAFLALTASLLVVRLGLLMPLLSMAALQMVAPIDDPFFPALFRQPALLTVAFIVPLVFDAVILIGRGIGGPSRPLLRDMKRAAVCETAGSAVFLVHQATYFTATWVVFFWAGLFLVWMAWSGAESRERAGVTGPFLAQLLVAFFFLGGAVGKWTSGYWSGAVFDELFFMSSSRSFFPLVHRWIGDAGTHVAALWFSRWVVVVETLMAFIVLLPSRVAFAASLLAAAGLWMTASDLFEVCLPILGIAIAGRLLAIQYALTSEASTSTDTA